MHTVEVERGDAWFLSLMEETTDLVGKRNARDRFTEGSWKLKLASIYVTTPSVQLGSSSMFQATTRPSQESQLYWMVFSVFQGYTSNVPKRLVAIKPSPEPSFSGSFAHLKAQLSLLRCFNYPQHPLLLCT